MCMQGLMKFHPLLLKILRKQNITDGRTDGRTDNVKTVYPPTNTVCGGITKALISFAVTAKLICAFVFAYAKRWFSHDVAQMIYSSAHLRYLGTYSQVREVAKFTSATKSTYC